jgi:adenylylsulfate kinase
MSGSQGFAIWMTGIPASGKSTITREMAARLRLQEVVVVVLESDEMRTILTPEPTYSQEERDTFYRSLALIGGLITRSGVNVIFDATANKRSYRAFARTLIPRFLEVFVSCPLNISMRRDPKGIYSRAAAGTINSVPGFQTSYEPPLKPDITLDCQDPPDASASVILEHLKHLLYI